VSDTPDGANPVVVGHFPTVEEAHMAAARLDAEGIEAVVEPFHSYDVLSHLQFTTKPRGIAVLVPDDQLQVAMAILEMQPEPVPPGEIIEEVQRKADRAVLAALLVCLMPLLAPFMPIHLWSVWKSVRPVRDLLDPAAAGRVRKSLRLAVFLNVVGLALLVFVVLVVIGDVV